MTFDDLIRIGKALHKHRALQVAAVLAAGLQAVLVVTFPHEPPSVLHAITLFAVFAAMAIAASRLLSCCRRLLPLPALWPARPSRKLLERSRRS